MASVNPYMQTVTQSNADCLKDGETYRLDLIPPAGPGFMIVGFTIGRDQLGNLKSDELDQQLKQMKVGDQKGLKLTARLDDPSKKYWHWRNHNLAIKDEQFRLNVWVFWKM